jgi:hypothetical protein
MRIPTLAALALALAAALPLTAAAQAPAPAAPAAAPAPSAEEQARLRQQLDAARARLDESARQVAELSRQLGQDDARQRIEIRRFGARRPMLGFVMGTSADAGVRLEAVTPEGPAARAGLRSGDVITAIDGQRLDAAEPAARIGQARRLLGDLEDGQKVALDYLRDGRPAQLTVTVEPVAPFAFIGGPDSEQMRIAMEAARGEMDLARQHMEVEIERIGEAGGLADVERRIQVIGPLLEESVRFDAWRWQGLRLAPLDADLGRYFGAQAGVLVLKAEGEALEGLRSGDVIQRIAGTAVEQPREAMRLLADAEPGARLQLELLRDRRRVELQLTAPDRPDVMRWIEAPPAPPAPPSPPPAPAKAPPPPPAPPAPPGRSVAV